VKKIIAILLICLLPPLSHDFVKTCVSKLVQIEAQFDKIEVMFKDYHGFRIAFAERSQALAIEIVLLEPVKYFAHKKCPIGGHDKL